MAVEQRSEFSIGELIGASVQGILHSNQKLITKLNQAEWQIQEIKSFLQSLNNSLESKEQISKDPSRVGAIRNSLQKKEDEYSDLFNLLVSSVSAFNLSISFLETLKTKNPSLNENINNVIDLLRIKFNEYNSILILKQNINNANKQIDELDKSVSNHQNTENEQKRNNDDLDLQTAAATLVENLKRDFESAIVAFAIQTHVYSDEGIELEDVKDDLGEKILNRRVQSTQQTYSKTINAFDLIYKNEHIMPTEQLEQKFSEQGETQKEIENLKAWLKILKWCVAICLLLGFGGGAPAIIFISHLSVDAASFIFAGILWAFIGAIICTSSHYACKKELGKEQTKLETQNKDNQKEWNQYDKDQQGLVKLRSKVRNFNVKKNLSEQLKVNANSEALDSFGTFAKPRPSAPETLVSEQQYNESDELLAGFSSNS